MPLPIYPESSEPARKPHAPLPTPPKPLAPQVIAIAAGKGGVGKSTVTIQLAHALDKKGLRVGILDADLYGPSVRQMLPETERPRRTETSFTPAKSGNIQILSLAYFRKENEATAVRAPIANSLLTQFLQEATWGPLDYLLIDFPPGTGDIPLTLCQKARLTGALIVTTPQLVSVLDVRKAMQLFTLFHVPCLGIVENMSYFTDPLTEKTYTPFGSGGGESLSQETGVPLLMQLPILSVLSTSGDTGESLDSMDSQEARIGKKAFAALVEQIIQLAPLGAI